MGGIGDMRGVEDGGVVSVGEDGRGVCYETANGLAWTWTIPRRRAGPGLPAVDGLPAAEVRRRNRTGLTAAALVGLASCWARGSASGRRCGPPRRGTPRGAGSQEARDALDAARDEQEQPADAHRPRVERGTPGGGSLAGEGADGAHRRPRVGKPAPRDAGLARRPWPRVSWPTPPWSPGCGPCRRR